MRLKINLLCQRLLSISLLLLPCCLSAEIIRTFEHNNNNQLTKEEKASGHTILYEYDPCGRLIKETPSIGEAIEYMYDKIGNCIKMTDGYGTTRYSYDQFNQLVAVEFPNSNPFFYMYDTYGHLIEMIYPNGLKVIYTYDSSNRLTSVLDQTGTTKYDYNDKTNTLTKVALANGAQIEYTYDSVKRITDVVNKRSDGSIILAFHYDFDANGNRTQCTETGFSGEKTTSYQYDKLNRLIHVQYPDGYEKYTYDGLGNRLTKETPTSIIRYEYDQSNQLKKTGDSQFFYDLSGNLIRKISPNDTTDYTYDAHDNLIELRNNKHIIRYFYDGAKRRISKIVDGIPTYYINDIHSPVTQVALKMNSFDEITASYTYGLSRLAEIKPTNSCFYLYDYPNRNVVAMLDQDQNIIDSYAYESFGCCERETSTTFNDFLYTGEAYEQESQLIYLRNRYYDPELGRFISRDPEFGSKSNPQSLNPYAYVNNNPLNYIDPLGLRSAKACAYSPGTKTNDGISRVGHGFWELTYDDGEVKIIGRYPKGAREDYDEICPGTVSYEWPATDEQIDKIIASVRKGPYLLASGNCINGLERGLDILGVEHPSFKSCGVSMPLKAVFWLESLNGKSDNYDAYQDQVRFAQDPDLYMRLQEQKQALPAASRSAGDIGGVSLNKTAKLLSRISEVEGATYDGNSGQLIMVGKKKNLTLPEMDFDDFAVAVRSIYGLGGKPPQDPGVSLDFDPSFDINKIVKEGKKPPPMIVRYEGQTKGTRFGNIMFEADRILKCVSLGKDNKKGKEIKVKVSGYKSLPKRYRESKSKEGPSQTRLWFVPKEMSIHKNRKGNALIFKKATMKVLTESKYKNKKQGNKEAEAFAEHFTKNYDKYAKEYPVLKDLKRLGKITALVKWIKENKIPIDLSLFKDYKPAHKDTPKTTPAMTIVHKETNDTVTRTLSIIGGVIYHLDESNFHEQVHEEVDPLSIAALNARPSENVFKWTFKSPIDSQDYEAVAETIERTLKVGSVRKARVDMQFTVSGEYPLELVRYYNSFNDEDVGFGRGWDIVCTGLRFPRPRIYVTWKNDPIPIAVYPEIFIREDGYECRYSLLGLGENHSPLYKSEESQAILVETNQGYTLNKLGGKTLEFSSDGKILSKGSQISYHYRDSRLVEISHVHGKKISLTYEKDRIIKICGPGNKCIHYSYDGQGQLYQVSDSLGVVESYTYDDDKNLSSILNARHEPIFTAAYDDYHRAISETTFGREQSKAFNLKNHTLHIDMAGHNAIFCQYDNNYRLLEAQDTTNRSVKMTYEEGQGKPTTITDCMGNEKHYSYDDRGNIIRIVDALGTEERFWYNQNNQLFAYQNGMGGAELYSYNANGLIIKIHHAAKLFAEDHEKGTVHFTYNQNHITEYVYDGDRLRYSLRESTVTSSYQYDEEGRVIAIESPNGYTLHRSYDERGRLQRVWDSEGDGFEYTYDDRDRVICLSNPDGSIEYQYDDIGNLCSVKDAHGETIQYSYDSFGNLIKIRDPMGEITDYAYDENHNLVGVILPNGTVQKISYDILNRPIRSECA